MKKFDEFNRVNENTNSGLVDKLEDNIIDIIGKAESDAMSILKKHPELTKEEMQVILSPFGYDSVEFIIDYIEDMKKKS